MSKIVIISIAVLMFSYNEAFCQKKNDKRYKEGYVIRFSDTVQCHIYTGSQANEIGHEVTYKYNDGRIITYNPGSAIKGFGYMTDSNMVHYYQIDVPEYWIKEQTNNKAYAEVVTDGQVRLYRYTKIRNSIEVAPTGVNGRLTIVPRSTKDRNYFIKVKGDDSLYNVGSKNILGADLFEREEVIPFMKGQPQIMANIAEGESMNLNKLKTFLSRYNDWFKTKREQE